MFGRASVAEKSHGAAKQAAAENDCGAKRNHSGSAARRMPVKRSER